MSVSFPRPAAFFALNPSGSLFLATGREYQVLTLGSDGEARWALRGAWAPQGFPAERRDRILQVMRRSLPDLRASEVPWPERLPALTSLRLDGHGHHVYAIFRDPESQEERVLRYRLVEPF